MLLNIQQGTPWYMKSMLDSNFTYDINFTTFVPQKGVPIHSFWVAVFSFLIVFVIMLENDVFKLSIYLNIFFFLCRHFARPKCWGISVKDSKFTEVFIQRCLLITCPSKTSKVPTLKLVADLVFVFFIIHFILRWLFNDVYKMQSQLSLPAALTLPKMFNSILKAFSDMLRVCKIVSLKSWLHFGFGIKTKKAFSLSRYTTTELIFEQPSSVLWKS